MKLRLRQSGAFNVVFSGNGREVEVTDSRTSNWAADKRLPSETLLKVIQNILQVTNTDYTVVGTTQEWAYTGKGSLTVELFSVGLGNIDGGVAVLTVTDEERFDEYNVELHIVDGSYDDLVKICECVSV